MSLFQQQVVELSRHLSRLGFFAATGGNLALRIDAEFMAVTPSAVDYHSMQAKDVCIVRLRDLHKVAGEGTPSVESSLHARVLRRRADVQCTIHTHQPLASACTLFGEALVVDRAPTRQLLGARIPIVGVCAVRQPLAGQQAGAGDPSRPQRLSDAQSRRALLWPGH
nr:class II aldolase/adducin family protein [Pseudomonas fuscovaginae]